MLLVLFMSVAIVSTLHNICLSNWLNPFYFSPLSIENGVVVDVVVKEHFFKNLTTLTITTNSTQFQSFLFLIFMDISSPFLPDHCHHFHLCPQIRFFTLFSFLDIRLPKWLKNRHTHNKQTFHSRGKEVKLEKAENCYHKCHVHCPSIESFPSITVHD